MNTAEFNNILRRSVRRFAQNWLNTEQENCVHWDMDTPLEIVAGPGAGKTTVIALRVLKHIFIDRIRPENIVATTFTKKAAGELRSRILSWGFSFIEEYRNVNPAEAIWTDTIDINALRTGTIDSIISDLLTEDRHPSELLPALADEMVLKNVLRWTIPDPCTNGFQNYVFSLFGIPPEPVSPITRTETIKRLYTLFERFSNDMINCAGFAAQNQYAAEIINIYTQYKTKLAERSMTSYCLISEMFLRQLRDPQRLNDFKQNTRVFMVDEYQDTNLLQEQIYFEVCRNSSCSFTIVGDDDQSIYRFRGATVELFRDFAARVLVQLGVEWNPEVKYLNANYRSTPEIVSLCSDYARGDTCFASVRIANKPDLVVGNQNLTTDGNHFPVIGIFRPTVQILAQDIFQILNNIVSNHRLALNTNTGTYNIETSANFNWGDSVLLGYTANHETDQGRQRLPYYLDQIFTQNRVHIYNPRGVPLSNADGVGLCLGLVLLCIDNGLHNLTRITGQNPQKGYYLKVRTAIENWLREARAYLALTQNQSLAQTISDFTSQQNSTNPNKEVPVVELLYTFASRINYLIDQPEGQMYLEVLTRIINTADQINQRSSVISFNSMQEYRECMKSFYWNVIFPIIDDKYDIDEEIMPYVPRNYFPIMTIHQAKGLEFPIVLVDVGSDFSTNHPKQRKFRYPDVGGDVHILEDALHNYTTVGAERFRRAARLRALDDIKRQYFVGKSRPQNLLIFVGLNKVIAPQTTIRAIQVGDTENEGRRYHFIESDRWPNNPGPLDILCI